MGHHHREEAINTPQPIDTGTGSEHPFLKANDLTCLSLVLPLLSDSGKQLISFFMNFGNNKPVNSVSDPMVLLKQLAPKLDNTALKDILPSLLTLLINNNNKDSKTPFNPGVLSSLFPNTDNQEETKNSEPE